MELLSATNIFQFLLQAALLNKENLAHNNVVPAQQNNKCKAVDNDSLLQSLDKDKDGTGSKLFSFNDLDLNNCEKSSNVKYDVNRVSGCNLYAYLYLAIIFLTRQSATILYGDSCSSFVR